MRDVVQEEDVDEGGEETRAGAVGGGGGDATEGVDLGGEAFGGVGRSRTRGRLGTRGAHISRDGARRTAFTASGRGDGGRVVASATRARTLREKDATREDARESDARRVDARARGESTRREQTKTREERPRTCRSPRRL